MSNVKLVVAGATGFVATEVIRQSLSIPKITTVVALARRPVSTPLNLDQGADTSKLRSVTIDDYGSYSDEVKKEFADANACIWTVAITPSKSRSIDFGEVRRVCQDNTLAGFHALIDSRNDRSDTPPFRFIYMSGTAAERDQKKTPSFMPAYSLMRGETESRVLALAAEYDGKVQACVAKPGLITAPGQYLKTIGATMLNLVGVVPNVDVREVSAAMLKAVVDGWETEPLQNEDLVRIGRQALKASK